MTKSEEDFQASIKVLRDALEMYQAGKKVWYRPIATELRKLLCDTRSGKDNSLIPRVRPDFKLRRLMWTDVLEGIARTPDGALLPNEGLVLTMPVEISAAGDGTYLPKLALFPKPTYMEINAWVEQPIINLTTTVKKLIKSVADKEAAHSDPNYNETLSKTKSLNIVEDESRLPYIVSIADYLLEELTKSGAIVTQDADKFCELQ